MCIAFWLLDKHPTFWLILALNRDEFHARPTRPFHFWDDGEHKDVLGGRDMRSGGTWMGITKKGRLAFLTNVREADWDDRPEKTSRGDLPTRFFNSEKSPLQYADLIAQEAENYNGFNLVVADFAHKEMAFVSNRHGDSKNGDQGKARSSVRKLSSGLHSVSNGTLDSKWPKMERGRKLLTGIFVADDTSDSIPSEQIVETVLRDRERADDVSSQIAETHCAEEFEINLSSIFVETALGGDRAYGTRSMTVVGIRRDGQVSLFERYLESGEWKDHSFQFQIEVEEEEKGQTFAS